MNWKPTRIHRKEIKNKVVLDTFEVLGFEIQFYYCDNKKNHKFQYDITSGPPPEKLNVTEHFIPMMIMSLHRYMAAEGIMEMFNKFIKTAVAKKWVESRIKTNYASPRTSTADKLINSYNKFKKKYTEVKF